MRLLSFCEATGDHEISAALSERVLQEKAPPWLREQIEDRTGEPLEWVGEDASETFIPWNALPAVRARLGVRPPLGPFAKSDGTGKEKAAVFALEGRTALAIARALDRRSPIDAVLLIHDVDDELDLPKGLDQARAEPALRHTAPVVIGTPAPEIEAWLLAGFEAASDEEKKRIDGCKTRLGFDPRVDGHRLTSKKQSDPKDAKRALKELSGGDRERAERCYRETVLPVLVARGTPTGLADFLREIEERLLPLFTDRR